MEKSSCLNTDDGLTHNDLQLVAKYHHHHLVHRYVIVVSQITLDFFLPTYIFFFPLSPATLFPDYVVLFISVLRLVPNVIRSLL
jgi:hypothetical protein